MKITIITESFIGYLGAQTTGDFFGGVGDYFGDIFTVGKYLGIGLAVIVAISVGGLVVQIAFNRKTRGEAVDVAKALASAKGGAKKPS